MKAVTTVLALFAAAGGCSGQDPNLGPFRIRAVPDTSMTGGCPTAQLADYDLSCGATLSMRVLDAESRELYDDACIEVPPADDLTGLSQAMVPTFFDLPTRMLEIEIALWNPEALPEPGACPAEDIFDLRGVPLLHFEPQPAFGGAAFFPAYSTEEVAEVPLACTDPEQLAGCRLDRTEVTVSEILDVTGLLDITPAQASELLVGVAEPRAVPIDIGGELRIVHVIDSPDILALQPGPVPTFRSSFEDPFGSTLCTVVIENVAQATQAVVCEGVPAGASDLELRQGAFLDRETLDRLLTAAGMAQFPTEGLVVGRVVDETGLQPLAQVAVTPVSAGEAEVIYLDGDLAGENGAAETSDSGFFLARGVQFGTEWNAVHSGDGRQELGEVRAGLVQGKVTVLILRMEPPPEAG